MLGGVVVGAAAVFGLMHVLPAPSFCQPKREKAHVLIVEKTFISVADREKWTASWAPLADRVLANEPNCLSYKLSVCCDDPCKAVIYERYVARSDLDGIHQESIKAHSALPISKAGIKSESKLTHYTETSIGHHQL